MPRELPFRWIHLDFHTSEDIAGIGSAFDADEFVATLRRGHVNAVTCFARGHHGWIYYDTEKHPERRHPHLTRNLLAEQIEACHAAGIMVPIYTTIQWDHYTANEHPEWLVVDPEGRPVGTPLYEAGFYRQLCVNSPYMDFLKEHVREILETLSVDGFFFDIVKPQDCSCKYCRAGMEAAGIDPADDAARKAYGRQVIDDFRLEMTRYVRQLSEDCTIFYNQGHLGPEHRAVADAYTHFELESLPSGGWGYLHFPITMRYARTLGKECLSHTGKFHTSWGDFHSFKNPEALEYECFRMLALNSKCDVGDQLHPLGRLDPNVYDLVGGVYARVEAKEPWCRDARPVTEIGVVTPEAWRGSEETRLHPAMMGAARMLIEGAHQFDVLDYESDLSDYALLILPDDVVVDAAYAQKLERYLAQGGALIASYEAGMTSEKDAFALNALGVRMASDGPRDRSGELVRGRVYPRGDYAEYVLPKGEIGRGLPQTEHVMYVRGMDAAAREDANVLMHKVAPYFDRTYRHFCSHRQTPSSGQIDGPAVVRKGRAIYFAHPIFRQYNQNAPRWIKTMFLNALNILLPEPLVRHDGPTTLEVTINEQAEQDRWVVHLLHYIPERRSQEIDVIEDVIPLHDLTVSLRVPRAVTEVQAVPQGIALAYDQADGRVTFNLPKLEGHQMVALSFA